MRGLGLGLGLAGGRATPAGPPAGVEYGPELVVGGNPFTSGWTFYSDEGGDPSISNGKLQFVSNDAGYAQRAFIAPLTAGHTYHVKIDIESITTGGISAGTVADFGAAVQANTPGSHSGNFVPATNAPDALVYGAYTNALVTRFSLREVL